MWYMKEWPRLLLKFPLGIRLSIVMLCSLLCMTIHLLTFPVSHNGGLLTIPVGLAAWMFKKRGLLVCLTWVAAVLAVYHTIRLGSLIWPLSFALFSLWGISVLLIEGLIINTLRNLVDSADDARLQAQQAERQTAIAYEQQRQLNQLRSQFIMSVNHELRTPLTALFGYLELFHVILEQEGHLDRTAHGPFLQQAIRNCQELASLINNVLDMTTLGSEGGSLTVEELSVTEVVAEVVAHLDAVHPSAHRIHLDIPEQVTVLANAQCTSHVLRHLLSNAFKYAPADSQVVVSAELDAAVAQPIELASRVCIRVKDEGPGIPPDEMPLLFGQFVRLKRDIGGTVRGNGLGLYISKYFVEAMGGRMWVESVGIVGQGSCFCFTLPSTTDRVMSLGGEISRT